MGNNRLSIVVVILIFALASLGRLLEGDGAPPPKRSNPKFQQPLPKRPGAQFWRKQTKDWAFARPASRRGDFPGYREPVEPEGVVGKREISSEFTSGTAFAATPNGIWMTAKHVVDHCSAVRVQGGIRRGRPHLNVTRMTFHPHADVAVLHTERSDNDREPLAFADRAADRRDAFHVGFPRSQPGAAHSNFLGFKRLRRHGVRGPGEVLMVWAERTRIPDWSGSLGGMSGGAVLDRTGTVIGVTSAESRRRGRIFTSQPAAIWETVRRDGRVILAPVSQRQPVDELTGHEYPKHAQKLIQNRQVARVVCKVG